MTPEVSKLLEQALTLSVEEQEALADSLISNLGGKLPGIVIPITTPGDTRHTRRARRA
jgi:hypothetical protein